MAKILILGAGVMGSAISIPLSDNQHEVHLVGTHLDSDIIQGIRENRKHPGLQTSIPEFVQPHPIEQLGEASSRVDLFILGVNSQGVTWAADVLRDCLSNEAPVLMLTKGLTGDEEQIFLLTQVFQRHLPVYLREDIKWAALGGPSIAGELAARRDTSVVVTSRDAGILDWICDLLQTNYYRISPHHDVVGVEVTVGLKNLYAIGIGMVRGWSEAHGGHRDHMYNLEASLFTQSLQETAYLVEKLGGSRETVFSQPGIGDLYVTCHGGRNFRLGRYMGSGLSYLQARERYMRAETVEGAETALSIRSALLHMGAQGLIQTDRIPLLQGLCDLICDEKPSNLGRVEFNLGNLHFAD